MSNANVQVPSSVNNEPSGKNVMWTTQQINFWSNTKGALGHAASLGIGLKSTLNH